MDLGPLLEPRSVAVVGANDRPGSYAEIVLGNLARSGFGGPVWGVNPKRDEVMGRICVPTVADLPEPVDAVVVAIPAPSVPAVLEAAGERGCGSAIVISAGFAEVAGGVALQADLRAAALRHELPVCGPNGNGVAALWARAPLWGDEVAAGVEPGAVAIVTQSGNVGVNALASRRGLRLHTVVSCGNQAVLAAADYLERLAGQEGVRSVALFLEDGGDGERLASALAACAERDVGVAVLKVGASAAGAAAAAAHTGSLAGDQRAFRALVEEAGGAWACDVHELLELAKAMAAARTRPRGNGAAILTCSGGDSGLGADAAAAIGLRLPPLAAATRKRLGELLPAAATIGNPLDYTSMIWGQVETLRDLVAAVGEDPAIDQVVAFYDQPPEIGDASWADVRRGLALGAGASPAPALVASTLPELLDDAAAAELGGAGVPAVAGLRTGLRCAAALAAEPGDAARLRAIAQAAGGGRGGEPLEWLAEHEAKALLRDSGLPVPEGRAAEGEDDAVAAAAALGGPVALKRSSRELRHKSEAGALALGVEGEAAVRRAYRAVRGGGEAAGAVLVERMVAPGVELLVAARRDAVVPVLVVALGGIWTELLGDAAVVPLPADEARAERALRSLRGWPLLAGARGSPAADVGALAALAARAGELLLEADLELLELNPVIAGAPGAVAVDALVARRAPATRSPVARERSVARA